MPIVFASFAIAPYAALLGLVFVMLSLHAANFRRRDRVAFGHVDHAALERAVRAHGNFIEYVPFCLILLWLLAVTGAALMAIHILGIALVVGRLLHIYSILVAEPRAKRYHWRALGMVLTFTVILVTSIWLLVQWLGFTAIL